MELFGTPSLPLPAEWLAHRETGWVLLATGLVLLFFGRKLFWLFVAVVGAVAALWLATGVLGLDAGAPSVIAAAAAGLVGGLLAILVQKAAVAVVGFLAGVWGMLILSGAAAGSPAMSWLAPPLFQALLAVAGGVLGAVVAAQLFEAALVVLSALAGSLLLVTGLGLAGGVALAVFLSLALVGVLAQTRRREGRRRRRRREEAPEG
jgi:hypothetical protein